MTESAEPNSARTEGRRAMEPAYNAGTFAVPQGDQAVQCAAYSSDGWEQALTHGLRATR
jgi:hypothetical protein